MLKNSDRILRIEEELTTGLNGIQFGSQVDHCYNPLVYAKDCHEKFVRKYFDLSKPDILFLGMNPGPWGMCQNGIPFGEANIVRDWFHASGIIERPEKEHKRVTIKGLDCTRSECSGRRFWGLMKQICGSPENFFTKCLVYNYCPLAFLKESGVNVTPCEIKGDKTKLYELCDKALACIIEEIGIKTVIGIGRFAEMRVKNLLKQELIRDVEVHYLPHPSARTGKTDDQWYKEAEAILRQTGLYDKLANERTNELINNDWMRKALDFGDAALKRGEVPVGCLFVYENEIIANGSNTVNETKNATRHAEMNCIDSVLDWSAARGLSFRDVFPRVKVIVTVEPCVMCAAAILELGVREMTYGCANTRFGGCSSVLNVADVYGYRDCVIRGGVFADEAIDLLKQFYKGENPNAPKSKVKKKRTE